MHVIWQDQTCEFEMRLSELRPTSAFSIEKGTTLQNDNLLLANLQESGEELLRQTATQLVRSESVLAALFCGSFYFLL